MLDIDINATNIYTLGYEKNSDGIVTAIRKIDEVEKKNEKNIRSRNFLKYSD